MERKILIDGKTEKLENRFVRKIEESDGGHE